MFKSSVTTRFVVIGLLCLFLMVPMLFVAGLVEERQGYHAQVVHDIASGWGHSQTIAGPFLVVPETYPVAEKSKDHILTRRERRVRIYLPDELEIAGEVRHEMRSRAIYEVPVYSAGLDLVGRFDLDEVRGNHGKDVKKLLGEARLVIGISDTTGIQLLEVGGHSVSDTVSVSFNGGTGLSWLGSGVQARLEDLSNLDEYRFNLELKLNGTDALRLTPVGATSSFKIQSSWPHPSFSGRYLPTSSKVSDDGFEAEWQVHELARNLPSQWISASPSNPYLNGMLNLAEVSLFQPITSYTVVDRGIKYAFIFIGLTFLAYLCFEMRVGFKFHYVQFGVVGGALVMFYLTLLSLSEHIPFGLAYVLATMVLSGLVAWYTWLVTKEHRDGVLGGVIGGLLLGLYAGLYVLLMLEDFALLVGTAILLAGLGALMYATKDLRFLAPANAAKE